MPDPTSAIATSCILNTSDGLTPADWVSVGDLIETRDDGFQPIQKITRVRAPEHTVTIPTMNGPISAAQMMLAGGWAVQMYCGVDDMLMAAGLAEDANVAPTRTAFIQITMPSPMLLRSGNVWIESHCSAQRLHPVLSATELKLIHRAYGCPSVRDTIKRDIPAQDLSTTFGSRTVAA